MTELPDRLLHIFRLTTVSEVRLDQSDLKMRHFAILLIVYRSNQPQTVRGLAKALKISKAAVTRGLDRLGELDLAQRIIDVTDRRSVLVRRTDAGRVMMLRLSQAMAAAAAAI